MKLFPIALATRASLTKRFDNLGEGTMGRPRGSTNKPKDTCISASVPPHGNGFDRAKILSFVARIENLHANIVSIRRTARIECNSVCEDLKIVYDEAKDEAGISKKALKSVIKARGLERRAEEIREVLELDTQATYDEIRLALGDLADLPLGEAALNVRSARTRRGEDDLGTEEATYAEV